MIMIDAHVHTQAADTAQRPWPAYGKAPAQSSPARGEGDRQAKAEDYGLRVLCRREHIFRWFTLRTVCSI